MYLYIPVGLQGFGDEFSCVETWSIAFQDASLARVFAYENRIRPGSYPQSDGETIN